MQCIYLSFVAGVEPTRLSTLWIRASGECWRTRTLETRIMMRTRAKTFTTIIDPSADANAVRLNTVDGSMVFSVDVSISAHILSQQEPRFGQLSIATE